MTMSDNNTGEGNSKPSQIPEHQIVVITGPIGGGKSTTAESLAAELRRRGIPSGVLGGDELYLMGRQNQEKWNEREIWSAVRRACGPLADSFFTAGIRVVIIEGGDIRTPEEREDLEVHVSDGTRITYITLVVSWEEMFRRASGDTNRNIDSEEGYHKMHRHFESLLSYLRNASHCIETDEMKPAEIAVRIADEILSFD